MKLQHSECLQLCADAERRQLQMLQDKKDAAAMSLMQKMRVTWSSDEDSLVSTHELLYLLTASYYSIHHFIIVV